MADPLVSGLSIRAGMADDLRVQRLMMPITPNRDCQRFAERFVQAYWEEILAHPGLEAVEQTIDELLAEVAYCVETGVDPHQFRI